MLPSEIFILINMTNTNFSASLDDDTFTHHHIRNTLVVHVFIERAPHMCASDTYVLQYFIETDR